MIRLWGSIKAQVCSPWPEFSPPSKACLQLEVLPDPGPTLASCPSVTAQPRRGAPWRCPLLLLPLDGALPAPLGWHSLGIFPMRPSTFNPTFFFSCTAPSVCGEPHSVLRPGRAEGSMTPSKPSASPSVWSGSRPLGSDYTKGERCCQELRAPRLSQMLVFQSQILKLPRLQPAEGHGTPQGPEGSKSVASTQRAGRNPHMAEGAGSQTGEECREERRGGPGGI